MDQSEQRITLRERLRYRLDNGLVRGAPVILLLLSAVMLGLVLAVAVAMWVVGVGPGNQDLSLGDELWIAVTRILDSGAFGDDEGGGFRLVTLAITVAGLVAVAVLIAVVTSSVQRRLELLRRGRSVVAERDHTLILGSSSKLPIVVQEILEARPERGRQVVVILSPTDKVELEELLKREVVVPRGARIVVRRGQPASVADLRQVRPEAAKAILILRPEGATGDAEVVCVAVAVVNEMARPDTTVIAEMHDRDTAQTLEKALRRKITTVLPTEVVPRIAAQTLRASSLGQVYVDLLNFEGEEFYFVDVPAHLRGRPFGEALSSDQPCLVVGVETNKKGDLCPHFSREIVDTDRLIVMAKDLPTAKTIAVPITSTRAIAAPGPATPQSGYAAPRSADSTLFVGWNDMAPFIAEEIGAHVDEGTILHVLVDREMGSGDRHPPVDGSRIGNLHIKRHSGAPTDAETIRNAIRAAVPNHILVLSHQAGRTPIEADAQTLLTLLHVDSVLADGGPSTRTGTNVVAEILLAQSVDLARFANPDDFIVSERLVSLLMTQLAENRKRRWIFDEIFRPEGTRIEMQPIASFGGAGDFTFRDLIEVGRARGVIVIGWQKRIVSSDGRHSINEPCLNPAKGQRIRLTDTDSVIAIVQQ